MLSCSRKMPLPLCNLGKMLFYLSASQTVSETEVFVKVILWKLQLALWMPGWVNAHIVRILRGYLQYGGGSMRGESLLQLIEDHCPFWSPTAVGTTFISKALKALCSSGGRRLLMSPLKSGTWRSTADRYLRKEWTNRGSLKMEKEKRVTVTEMMMMRTVC